MGGRGGQEGGVIYIAGLSVGHRLTLITAVLGELGVDQDSKPRWATGTNDQTLIEVQVADPESLRGFERHNEKPDLMIDVVSVGGPPDGFAIAERSSVYGDDAALELLREDGSSEYVDTLPKDMIVAFRALSDAFMEEAKGLEQKEARSGPAPSHPCHARPTPQDPT